MTTSKAKSQNSSSAAGKAGASAVSTAPASPASAQAVMYALSTTKMPRSGNTKQGAKSGLGHQWASKATVAPNTRGLAYAALQGLGASFSQDQALAALAPVVAGTSGSARSYWAAFVTAGYIIAA